MKLSVVAGCSIVLVLCVSLFGYHTVAAQAVISGTATTSLNLSICGNMLVDVGEQCDVPGENGAYSTTIVGRQCNVSCLYGPYCGDGILQTQYSEECDDANNNDGDFCSAECTIEPAGSGGGGSSGGGGGSGGGTKELGDTQISVSGLAYPNQTVNFLLDTKSVGSVRANSQGRFTFSTDVSAGSATLGVWAQDSTGVRSITVNNSFDVTDGAVTNVSGIIVPPTIAVSSQKVNPGSTVVISGQAIPNTLIEVHFNNSELVEKATSSAAGRYEIQFNTSKLKVAEHTIKARSVSGSLSLLTRSNFSNSLQLFIGVDGKATTPSDLNRDGKIDLIDFSIMIFWWQTNGGNSDPAADINGNGKVGLEDFSILLFNWTG